eukprot:TRINITY_DN3805_c0_g1_i1.p1 TRINITY_DN3805_c0_g1~~TRINITY_DN3805_c0_g1_i1.p1  ORF type:complete len:121 (+),score=11.22 TRINITY_DN3805_c0_g1_i1:233-595(+)
MHIHGDAVFGTTGTIHLKVNGAGNFFFFFYFLNSISMSIKFFIWLNHSTRITKKTKQKLCTISNYTYSSVDFFFINILGNSQQFNVTASDVLDFSNAMSAQFAGTVKVDFTIKQSNIDLS